MLRRDPCRDLGDLGEEGLLLWCSRRVCLRPRRWDGDLDDLRELVDRLCRLRRWCERLLWLLWRLVRRCKGSRAWLPESAVACVLTDATVCV